MGHFWCRSTPLRHRPASHLGPSPQGKEAPNPTMGRYRWHREASSQVPQKPMSSALAGEEEQVLKEGFLRLVAKAVEVLGFCIHQDHGSGVD